MVCLSLPNLTTRLRDNVILTINVTESKGQCDLFAPVEWHWPLEEIGNKLAVPMVAGYEELYIATILEPNLPTRGQSVGWVEGQKPRLEVEPFSMVWSLSTPGGHVGALVYIEDMAQKVLPCQEVLLSPIQVDGTDLGKLVYIRRN